MLIRLYKKHIGSYIFRKLNVGIGISLLVVFILLGFLTYNSFYRLLIEQREQELLNIRTENLKLHLVDIIDRFKRETVSIYNTNDQSTGTNQFFLTNKIPAVDDEQGKRNEKNYFNGVLSLFLNRNPDANAFLFYRMNDHKVFARTSQFQQLQVNTSFDFPLFFENLPNDYNYPYIGNVTGLLNTSTASIYIANPVFDLVSINPNKVYGYFVMIIDTRILSELFQAQGNSESRLLIKKNGNVLLDTDPKSNDEITNSDDYLVSKITLEQYDIETIGAKRKTVIQSPLNRITMFIILILGITWPICLLLIFSIQTILMKRLKLLMLHFKKVQNNPFTEPMSVQSDDEIGDLIVRFNRMTENLQEYINRVYVTDIQRRNAEFVALKMQINPHFLFNTLESLRMQAIASGQRVLSQKLQTLGKLFRWMLKQDQDAIPIYEELKYMAYYLELFNMGKSNVIQLEIDSVLDLNEHHMLKFSLQPIIENAIEHGELEKRQNPTISIHIVREEEILSIYVRNNGVGPSPRQMTKLIAMLESPNYLPEKHLGLKNIHERIKNYFGEEYGLFVLSESSSQTAGFGVHMKIPYNNKGRLIDHDKAVNRR